MSFKISRNFRHFLRFFLPVMQSSCQIGPFLANPSMWVMSISLTSPRSCVENLISAKSFPVGTVEYTYLSSVSANSILTWTVTFEKIYCRHLYNQIQFNPYPWILGTVTERHFRKNPKHRNIQMMQRCDLDFFPRNALGDGPAFWIFSRILG